MMKAIPDWITFESEVGKHTGTVLVDFYTDDCPPCKMMMPVLNELAHERSDVRFVKVDAASNTEAAVRFRVTAVPTFVLFTNGTIKGQFIGARSKKVLVSWIDSNL